MHTSHIIVQVVLEFYKHKYKHKYEYLLRGPEPAWTLDNCSNNAAGTLVDPDMDLDPLASSHPTT
jgi:hypothetical protein